MLRFLSPLLALAAVASPPGASRHYADTRVLDAAIARMGGADALRAVERVRFEMLTQWERPTFDPRAVTEIAGYEVHSDLRDYSIMAWRNTRRFPSGATWREITDVVSDTVAIRRFTPPAASGASAASAPWSPLNIAYVDERREIFTFAPERLLLAARAAGDLRALPDTTIAGAPHARLSATLGHFPATLFIRQSDALLTMVRWRAAQPNDFGLVPWGEMEVELWYSAWRKFPLAAGRGIAYPTQLDVRRFGRPYKRMTVLNADFTVPVQADSFAVSDSLRVAFATGATVRPMHDLPLDSARIADGRFALFNTPGAPAGAVKVGGKWLLFESGSAALSAERAAKWLRQADPSPISGVIVGSELFGQGGVAWLASEKIPLFVGASAEGNVAAVMRGQKRAVPSHTLVDRGRWTRVGGDSIWLETMDLPDSPRSLVAYVPSLRWLYGGGAFAPLQLELLAEHARDRGWVVDYIGGPRAFRAAPPAVTPRAAAR